MNIIPTLTAAQIRQHSSEDSYARGSSYSQEGRVGELILRDGRLYAAVEGSQYEPYQVTISFDAGGVTSAECTCPYDWGGWCKHIVAVLLTVSAAPELVEARPPLSQLLEGHDRQQLVKLLTDLAQDSPAFAHAIELRLLIPTAPKATSPTVRRTPPDLSAFKKQLQNVFRSSSYERYDRYNRYDRYDYGNDTVLHELHTLLKQVDSFSDGGDAMGALVLLEPLTEQFSQSWAEYDQEGELGDFFDQLGLSWAKAFLIGDLSLKERRAWVKKLQHWNESSDEYGFDGLSLAILAAEQAWDDPQIMAVLQGKQQTLALDPMEQQLLSLRLEVLQQQNRSDDYIKLARASGQYRDLALMLARQGQQQEAVILAMKHFTSADEALALAQLLREQGQFDAAIEVAAHGLGLAEPRAKLGTWLLDVAAGLGNIALALQAGEIALQSQPDLALYQRLHGLDEVGWPERRERMLEHIRHSSNNWMSTAGSLDIFLHEGLIDDAIQLVSKHSDWNSLGRVMDAAISSRPEWVIRAATTQAAEIINAGKAQHYDQAIAWLGRARAAYRAVGNLRGWETHVRELRAVHGRKYKLMGLLDALEHRP